MTESYRWIPMLLLAALGAAACKGSDMDVYRAPKQAGQAEAAMTAVPEPVMPPMSAPAAAAPDLAPARDAGAPTLAWNAPPTWKSKPAGGMRFATFGVPTKGGEADLSVVVLAGDAGGALPNVNRWRGQLGLPPIDDAQLQKGAKAIKAAAGTLLVVNLVGADSKSGMIGAILPQTNQTWFFKLTGSSDATSAAKPSLLQFLASLR